MERFAIEGQRFSTDHSREPGRRRAGAAVTLELPAVYDYRILELSYFYEGLYGCIAVRRTAHDLVRLRRAAQITLPHDIREAANLKEGDYLEAEVTDAGGDPA